MHTECHQNIYQLHVFIESWLIGRVEKTSQVFHSFEDQLDDDFIIISPNGELQTKADIITNFWNAYGMQSDSFKIEIRNSQIRHESKNICIMNYEELQTGSEKSARISTVVFKRSPSNNKFYWLHLHETWFTEK